MANNNWIGYIERNYNQVKQTLINKLQVRWQGIITDFSESNPMVVLLHIWAAITEQFNYYIDMIARESFITSALKYESLLKLARQWNYRPKHCISAKAEVLFIHYNDSGVETNLTTGQTISIPNGTSIVSTDGYTYLVDGDYTMVEGDSRIWVKAIQHTEEAFTSLGTAQGLSNEEFIINNDTEDKTVIIKVNSTLWTFVDNLSYSKSTDTHFTTGINSSGEAIVIFGDNINGKKLTTGDTLEISRFTTLGSAAVASAETLTSAPDITSPVTNYTVECSNPFPAQSGIGIENFELLQKRLPLWISSVDRAVTLGDFAAIATLNDLVYTAIAKQGSCGALINIYIIPYNGGEAQSSLLASTKTYVEDRAVINSVINVLPAGESRIRLSADVTGRFGYSESSIEDAINNALENAYYWRESKINQFLHLSDIYALIDNLDEVDYLTLTEFYVRPYIRPSADNAALDYDIELLAGSTTETEWRLYATSTTQFSLYRNGILTGSSITVGSSFQVISVSGVDIFKIKIETAIDSGDVNKSWTFTTGKYFTDYEISDLSIPIALSDDITLNITTNL